MPAGHRTVGTILNKVIERVNSLMRRIRKLEQEDEVLRARLDAVQTEAFNQSSLAQKRVNELEAKLKEYEKQLADDEALIKEIVAQMKKFATVSQIKELEALIDIYNPLKSEFMTREEVERLIDEKRG